MLQNDMEGIGIHALMRANYTSNDTNGIFQYLNESGKFDHGKLTQREEEAFVELVHNRAAYFKGSIFANG